MRLSTSAQRSKILESPWKCASISAQFALALARDLQLCQRGLSIASRNKSECNQGRRVGPEELKCDRDTGKTGSSRRIVLSLGSS